MTAAPFQSGMVLFLYSHTIAIADHLAPTLLYNFISNQNNSITRKLHAIVLIGPLEKCACTNAFSESDIFEFDPHPYRMRLKSEGLSHGL